MCQNMELKKERNITTFLNDSVAAIIIYINSYSLGICNITLE